MTALTLADRIILDLATVPAGKGRKRETIARNLDIDQSTLEGRRAMSDAIADLYGLRRGGPRRPPLIETVNKTSYAYRLTPAGAGRYGALSSDQALRSAAPPLSVPPTKSSSAPAGTTRRRSTMPLTDRQIAVATAVHAGAKTAGEARKHADVEKLGLGPGDTLGVLRGLEKRGIVKLSQATKSAPVTVKYTSKTAPKELRKADEAARAAKVAAAKEAKAKAAPKKAPAKKAPAKAATTAKGKTTTKKAAPAKAKATTAKGGTVTPIDAKTKAAARAATVAKGAATPATPASPASA